MEDKLHNLRAKANAISLTAEEKARGREALNAYMTYRPVRERAAVQAAKPRFSFWKVNLGKPMSVTMTALLLLATMGGVSYAAEGALPGERLYTVKTGVNEPVRGFLAFSNEDRAFWDAERASRRLAEAEELAQRGQLKLETRIALDTEFRRHAEGAAARLSKSKENKDGIAADVSAHIEGTLRAHNRIMAAIVEGRRERKESGEANALSNEITVEAEEAQVAALALAVNQQADSAAQNRGRSEQRVSERGNEAAAAYAEGRREAAANKIAEVRKWLGKQQLSAEARKEAAEALAEAEASIEAGNGALKSGDFRAAFNAYADAQRSAQEAKLAVSASSRFNVRVDYRTRVPQAQPSVRGDVPQEDDGSEESSRDAERDVQRDAERDEQEADEQRDGGFLRLNLFGR